MLWTCVSTFIKDEKSVKYKLACVLAGIGVFIVDMFIPYATLVNIIMTYCGYTGGIVFLVLTVRWLMVRNQDKKKDGVRVSSRTRHPLFQKRAHPFR